jgi:hypothetical protein
VVGVCVAIMEQDKVCVLVSSSTSTAVRSFRQAQGRHGHIPPARARTRCQTSLPFERTGKSSLQRCQDRSGKARRGSRTRRRKPWAAQDIITGEEGRGRICVDRWQPDSARACTERRRSQDPAQGQGQESGKSTQAQEDAGQKGRVMTCGQIERRHGHAQRDSLRDDV